MSKTKNTEAQAPAALPQASPAADTQVSELDQLKAENLKLKEENTSLVNSLAELNTALAEKESEVAQLAGNPVIKHKGKKLELVVPKSTCKFKGKIQEITETTLNEVDGLLDHVINKGYNIFKEGGK